jgi:hypothetical protein
MTRANTKTNLRILSYWGDCIVCRLQGGNRIEIYRPDGTEITPETNQAGGGKVPKSEIPEQVELFSTNDYCAPKKYVNSDLFMPPGIRKKGESGPKAGATVGETEV